RGGQRITRLVRDRHPPARVGGQQVRRRDQERGGDRGRRGRGRVAARGQPAADVDVEVGQDGLPRRAGGSEVARGGVGPDCGGDRRGGGGRTRRGVPA